MGGGVKSHLKNSDVIDGFFLREKSTSNYINVLIISKVLEDRIRLFNQLVKIDREQSQDKEGKRWISRKCFTLNYFQSTARTKLPQ